MATKNGQVGVVKNGKEILDYAYQNIEYDDYNHTFVVKRGLNTGVCSIEGKEIIPIEYERNYSKRNIYTSSIF